MARLAVETMVVNENNRIAAELREGFEAAGTAVFNFIGSPGSGKTMLLEKTLQQLPRDLKVGVLTADLQTDSDASRLARAGFRVQQITTAGSCHLDARMVDKALAKWRYEPFNMLLIENVGNLISPACYDLGETAKVVVLSVTEGEDKPLKYPRAFFNSDAMVINKMDLMPFVPFELNMARANAKIVNPEISVFEASGVKGTGVKAFAEWLGKQNAGERRPVRTLPPAVEEVGELNNKNDHHHRFQYKGPRLVEFIRQEFV